MSLALTTLLNTPDPVNPNTVYRRSSCSPTRTPAVFIHMYMYKIHLQFGVDYSYNVHAHTLLVQHPQYSMCTVVVLTIVSLCIVPVVHEAGVLITSVCYKPGGWTLYAECKSNVHVNGMHIYIYTCNLPLSKRCNEGWYTVHVFLRGGCTVTQVMGTHLNGYYMYTLYMIGVY